MFFTRVSFKAVFKTVLKFCHDFAKIFKRKVAPYLVKAKEIIVHRATKLVEDISKYATYLSERFTDVGLSVILDNNQNMPPMVFRKYQDFQKILTSPPANFIMGTSTVMRPVKFECEGTMVDALNFWIHALQFLKIYGPFIQHFSCMLSDITLPHMQRWKFLQQCILHLPTLTSLEIYLPNNDDDQLLQFVRAHQLSLPQDLKEIKFDRWAMPFRKSLNGLLLSTCQKYVRKLTFPLSSSTNDEINLECSYLEEMEVLYQSSYQKNEQFLENVQAPRLTKMVFKIDGMFSSISIQVCLLIQILNRFKIQELDLFVEKGIQVPKGKYFISALSVTRIRVSNASCFDGSYEFLKYFTGLETLEVCFLREAYGKKIKTKGIIAGAIDKLLQNGGSMGNDNIFELLPSLQQIEVKNLVGRGNGIEVVTKHVQVTRGTL